MLIYGLTIIDCIRVTGTGMSVIYRIRPQHFLGQSIVQFSSRAQNTIATENYHFTEMYDSFQEYVTLLLRSKQKWTKDRRP